jgi:aminodeoxyfutalosine synthase
MAMDIDRLAASELADLPAVVRMGDRLKRSDCVRLWRTDDLTSLGVLANLARERVSGNSAYYHSSVHINYTGYPVLACPECSAHAAAGRSALSLDDLTGALNGIAAGRGGELHLTGGPDPDIGVDRLCRLVERAVYSCPQLRLRAFTWQELEHAAAKDGKTPSQVLPALVNAGLTSIAGGALVDLSPDRPNLGPDDISIMERRMPWIQAAAELELQCELSWVFGDGDDPEIMTDTLVCIRGIQDYRAVFECFVPLAFQWPTEDLDLPMPTGYNHLRAVAIGRLFLDNIPRIRSSPFSVSEPMAQVAQWYGADDAGSVIATGSPAVQGTSVGRDRLTSLLREAGRYPIEI